MPYSVPATCCQQISLSSAHLVLPWPLSRCAFEMVPCHRQEVLPANYMPEQSPFVSVDVQMVWDFVALSARRWADRGTGRTAHTHSPNTSSRPHSRVHFGYEEAATAAAPSQQLTLAGLAVRCLDVQRLTLASLAVRCLHGDEMSLGRSAPPAEAKCPDQLVWSCVMGTYADD